MSGAPKEEKKEESPEAGKAAGGKKMMPMLVAVVVVLGLQAALAVGVVRFLGISDRAQKTKSHPTGEGEATEGEGSEGGETEGGEGEEGTTKTPKKLECAEKVLSKTVTIAGTEAKRYLKAGLCLEYDAEKYKDFSKKVEPQMIRVEATVNRILSSATFPVATNPKSQDSLTQDMTKEINKLLKHEKLQIHSVLVTEWLVQ